MTIKISIGKLVVQFTLPEWEALLTAHGFSFIPLKFEHFEHLLTLPFHHNDPFDRLMKAQAISENYVIITQDAKFSSYPVALEMI
jgi:PIN domain nuclease of toxin-antitoxin system